MRENLRAARLAKGLSVSEIALMVGVTPDVFYKWEAGKRDPLIENARQVSLILGVSIEELFFEDRLDKTSKNADQSTSSTS